MYATHHLAGLPLMLIVTEAAEVLPVSRMAVCKLAEEWRLTIPGPPNAWKTRLLLLDPHPGQGSGDDQLLDLLGALEYVLAML